MDSTTKEILDHYAKNSATNINNIKYKRLKKQMRSSDITSGDICNTSTEVESASSCLTAVEPTPSGNFVTSPSVIGLKPSAFLPAEENQSLKALVDPETGEIIQGVPNPAPIQSVANFDPYYVKVTVHKAEGVQKNRAVNIDVIMKNSTHINKMVAKLVQKADDFTRNLPIKWETYDTFMLEFLNLRKQKKKPQIGKMTERRVFKRGKAAAQPKIIPETVVLLCEDKLIIAIDDWMHCFELEPMHNNKYFDYSAELRTVQQELIGKAFWK